MFAGGQVGPKAVAYPRRAVPLLTRIAQRPWPRVVGSLIGVVGLAGVIIPGQFGSTDHDRNRAEYLTWIYFWAATLILSGLIGNLWSWLNPWAAIYDVVNRYIRISPVWKLPNLGIWPAVGTYFAFACLELTSVMANLPLIVAIAAAGYTIVPLAGSALFLRDEGLDPREAFTRLFAVLGNVGPAAAE